MSGEAKGGAGFRSLPGLVWNYAQSVGGAVVANTDQVITVPNNELWELYLVKVTLVCSAAAGNRVVQLSITNPSAAVSFQQVMGAGIAGPSQTFNYVFMPDVDPLTFAIGGGGTTFQSQTSISEKLIMATADTATIGWYNQGAGDQLSNMAIAYRKYTGTTKLSLT